MSSRLNLNNKTLTIGYMNQLPYVWIEYDSRIQKHRLISGIDCEMIRVLSEYFNFSMKWIESTTGYGTLMPDGKWPGLIGMIADGQAEMAIGGVATTQKRSKVVDFTYPYDFDRFTYLTSVVPQKSDDQMDLLLKPFQADVWWTLLITLMAIWLFSWFKNTLIRPLFSCSINKKLVGGGKKKRKDGRGTFSKFNPNNSSNLWWINIILLDTNPQSSFGFQYTEEWVKFLIFLWALMSVVVFNMYTGFLCSLLTLPGWTAMDTFDKLAQACLAGKVMPIALSNTSIIESFMDTRVESIEIIYQRLRFFKNRHEVYRMMFGSNQKRKLHFAYIAPRHQLGFLKFAAAAHQLYLPPDKTEAMFVPLHISVPMRKFSPYLQPFQKVISDSAHFGLIQHWLKFEKLKFNRDTFKKQEFESESESEPFSNDPNSEESSNAEKLDMNHLKSVFDFLIHSARMAFLVFLIEFIWFKLKIRLDWNFSRDFFRKKFSSEVSHR